MDKIKRRDFMKLVGLAIAYPKGLMAEHKPILAHGVTLESATIGPIKCEGGYVSDGFPGFFHKPDLMGEYTFDIKIKGYNYLKIHFVN